MPSKTDKLIEQLIAEVKALRAELAVRPVVQVVPYAVPPVHPLSSWQIYGGGLGQIGQYTVSRHDVGDIGDSAPAITITKVGA